MRSEVLELPGPFGVPRQHDPNSESRRAAQDGCGAGDVETVVPSLECRREVSERDAGSSPALPSPTQE
ncbi:hypothetical protein ACFPRL_08225 [Pseudoclavibacter helvolus]